MNRSRWSSNVFLPYSVESSSKCNHLRKHFDQQPIEHQINFSEIFTPWERSNDLIRFLACVLSFTIRFLCLIKERISKMSALEYISLPTNRDVIHEPVCYSPRHPSYKVFPYSWSVHQLDWPLCCWYLNPLTSRVSRNHRNRLYESRSNSLPNNYLSNICARLPIADFVWITSTHNVLIKLIQTNSSGGHQFLHKYFVH